MNLLKPIHSLCKNRQVHDSSDKERHESEQATNHQRNSNQQTWETNDELPKPQSNSILKQKPKTKKKAEDLYIFDLSNSNQNQKLERTLNIFFMCICMNLR